jgi:hypothetical protein
MAGVLVAELHCAFIALELYLKALSALEVEVPVSTDFGAFIYAESAAKHHRLHELFDLLDPADQASLDESVRSKGQLRPKFSDARSALMAHNDLFMTSRYPFEEGRNFKEIEMGRLSELLDAVENVASRKIQITLDTEPKKRRMPDGSQAP